MKRTRFSRHQRTDSFLGGILIASAFIIITIFVLGFYWISRGQGQIDKTTLCPTAGIQHVTAVLIDTTDRISTTDSAALKSSIERIKQTIPKGGRFEIYAIEAIEQNRLTPRFSACSPGSGKDVPSEIYGNPKLADKIWTQEFGKKIDQILLEILSSPSQGTSPILEAIKALSIRAYAATDLSDNSALRLIVVSDLVQNSSRLSMLKGAPNFDSFKNSPSFIELTPRLTGVAIEFVILYREQFGVVQNEAWRNFWLEYAKEFKPSNIRWVRLIEYKVEDLKG